MFTALALVRMLILPLNNFPWVINGLLEAKVSLDRIQRFLDLPNHDPQAYYSPGNGKLVDRTWHRGAEICSPSVVVHRCCQEKPEEKSLGGAGGHFPGVNPQTKTEARLSLGR